MVRSMYSFSNPAYISPISLPKKDLKMTYMYHIFPLMKMVENFQEESLFSLQAIKGRLVVCIHCYQCNLHIDGIHNSNV